MNIQFYGAHWCVDCKRTKEYLDLHAVPYDYIDIDIVPGAADKVVELNDGLRTIPTLVFDDGTVYAEPTNAMLATKLSIART